MNRSWLLGIITISMLLLTLLKMHELRALKPYFKNDRVIKLTSFNHARSKVSKDDLELLKLWESILTGRAAPLSKMMKQHYQELGLNHLFTPSGFHLSAVLVPFMKIIPHNYHLLLFILLGVGLSFLPGLAALKRMLLIKGFQQLSGIKAGFIIALLMDMFFGTFQGSTLSFTYSFLFLGIIYSGLKGMGLIVWFFLAQMILAFFQNNDISPLLLVFSPLLNLAFSLLMPILFLLSFPLWDWQLHAGIYLLRVLQNMVEHFSGYCLQFPTLEINIMLLLIVGLVLVRKYKWMLVLVTFFCSSLNLDHARTPAMPTNEFVPRSEVIKTIYQEKQVVVYFRDGRCRLRLIRGLWWENCSPSKRGSRNKKL